MRRRGATVLVALTVLSGLAACGDDDDASSDGGTTRSVVTSTTAVEAATTLGRTDTTTAASTTKADTPASPPRDIRSAADLEPLLITELPSGYARQPDDVGDTGPSDLAKAANDDGGEDALEFYEGNGFIAGYQRMWGMGITREDDGTANLDDAEIVVVFLYAFQQPQGAEATLQRTVDALESRASQGVTAFEPDGIPGAKGFAGGDPSEGYGAFVLFTKGSLIVQMLVGSQNATGSRELANALAVDQYDRL
jgi:hypothetical protein